MPKRPRSSFSGSKAQTAPSGAVASSAAMTKTTALFHRCRFLEYMPQGVSNLALHPSGEYAAVARENGDIEVWRSDSLSQPWVCVVILAGAPRLAIQAMTWIACDTQCHGGRGFHGARLFVASLTGSLFEADWETACLTKVLDSNGGAIWSMAAFLVSGPTSGSNAAVLPKGWSNSVASAAVAPPGSGASRTPLASLLALGCEDGSVRLYAVGYSARTADVLEANLSTAGTGGASYSSTTADNAFTAPSLVCVCPGTDGRILSLGWHPHMPALYGGTGTGFIRGWDMSKQAAAVSPTISSSSSSSSSALASTGKEGLGGRKRSVSLGLSSSSKTVGDAELEAELIWGTAVGEEKGKGKKGGDDKKSHKNGKQGDDSDSSDSDDDDDDDPLKKLTSGGPLTISSSSSSSSSAPPLTATLARGAGIGPRVVVRMQLASQSKHDTSVWTLAVLSDFTVLAGDNTGSVTVWDGRTGTLACPQPITRHDADVLSLSVHEPQLNRALAALPGGSAGSGSGNNASSAAASASLAAVSGGAGGGVGGVVLPAIIVSAGVDGKVAAVKRVGGGQHGTARWVALGSHRGHASDVRAVSILPVHVSSLSLGGATAAATTTTAAAASSGSSATPSAPLFALTAVSGGADAFMCALPLCLFGSSVAQPRRLHEASGNRNRDRFSISSSTSLASSSSSSSEAPPLLMAFTQGPTGVQVWEVNRAAATKPGGENNSSSGAQTFEEGLERLMAAGQEAPRGKRRKLDDGDGGALPSSSLAVHREEDLVVPGGALQAPRGGAGSAARGKLATAEGAHKHWLTILPPGALVKGSGPSGAGEGATSLEGSTLVPQANPSTVAISSDGQWLAYASAAGLSTPQSSPLQGGLQVVRLRHEYLAEEASSSSDEDDSSSEDDSDSDSDSESGSSSSDSEADNKNKKANASKKGSLLPKSRSLVGLTPVKPEISVSSSTKSSSSSASKASKATVLQTLFVPLPLPAALAGKAQAPQLLIAVTPSALSVYLCADRQGNSPVVSFLYSLPVPAQAIDPEDVTSAATFSSLFASAAVATISGAVGAGKPSLLSKPGSSGIRSSLSASSSSSSSSSAGSLSRDEEASTLTNSSVSGSRSRNGSLSVADLESDSDDSGDDGGAAKRKKGASLGPKDELARKAVKLAEKLGKASSNGGSGKGGSIKADPTAVYVTALTATPLLLPAPAAAVGVAAGKKSLSLSASGLGVVGPSDLGAALVTVGTHTGAVHSYLLLRSFGCLLGSCAARPGGAVGPSGATLGFGAPEGFNASSLPIAMSLAHVPFPSVGAATGLMESEEGRISHAAASSLNAAFQQQASSAASISSGSSASVVSPPSPLAQAAKGMVTLLAGRDGSLRPLHALSAASLLIPASAAAATFQPFANAASSAWATTCRYHSTGTTVSTAASKSMNGGPRKGGGAGGSEASAVAIALLGGIKMDPRTASKPANLSILSAQDKTMAQSGFSWLDSIHTLVPLPAAKGACKYLLYGTNHGMTITVSPAAGASASAGVATLATLHPHKYMNLQPKVAVVGEGKWRSDDGEPPASEKATAEIAVVELPWSGFARFVTGALQRKRYGT